MKNWTKTVRTHQVTSKKPKRKTWQAVSLELCIIRDNISIYCTASIQQHENLVKLSCESPRMVSMLITYVYFLSFAYWKSNLLSNLHGCTQFKVQINGEITRKGPYLGLLYTQSEKLLKCKLIEESLSTIMLCSLLNLHNKIKKKKRVQYISE